MNVKDAGRKGGKATGPSKRRGDANYYKRLALLSAEKRKAAKAKGENS